MNEFAVHAASARHANAESKGKIDLPSPAAGNNPAVNSNIADSAVLVEISKLIEHETINPDYLHELAEEIKADRILKRAVAVDRGTNVVLDGHHRLNALRQLGCTRIPVTFVDYQSPTISVQGWRAGESVTKEMVVSAALSGDKLPPKTSRHMVQVNGSMQHISTIEEVVNIPLDKLK